MLTTTLPVKPAQSANIAMAEVRRKPFGYWAREVRIPVGTPAQAFVIKRLARVTQGTAPGLDLRHAPIDGEIHAGDI